MAKKRVFTSEQLVPAPRESVFAFFSDASNLERLTPPWLGFRILSPIPIELRPGARIAYRLSIHGIGVSWLTEIRDWEPCRRFVDVQLRGPYKSWVHTHVFEAHEAGTVIRDEVEYQLPFGLLGSLAYHLVVARDLERIFEYRRQQVASLFASVAQGEPSTAPGGAI